MEGLREELGWQTPTSGKKENTPAVNYCEEANFIKTVV